MKLAYGRVSAKDQNPERQLVKFRELGVDERYIFIEKMNGKNFDRPGYQAMRLLIREGDLLYMDALDRLGRDYCFWQAKNAYICCGKCRAHLLFEFSLRYSFHRLLEPEAITGERKNVCVKHKAVNQSRCQLRVPKN